MANNPWIAQQRAAAFRNELNDKNVWINIAAMMLSEGTPQQSLESLFNRTMYVRAAGRSQTLMQMISGGFYGPYNRGEYPTFIARIRASQTLVEQLNAAIETAMAGADTIQGYTDQGLPTDPNGQRQPQIKIGGNVFCDWDGGPGGHAAAAVWRQRFEQSAADALKPVPPPPVPVPAPVPTPTPIPAPAPTPVPVPTVDPYAPIIAMLQAVGKWPAAATIDLTVSGPVTITLNGTMIYHQGT